MNPAFLALASAASWGASDFIGGVIARRISPYLAVVIAHSLSLAAMGLVVLIFGLHAPASHLRFLAMIAGLFAGAGLMLFYSALSTGSMGVTAAVAGVLTAAVPILYGLRTDGLPRPRQLSGFAVAVVAIWLIAAAPGKVVMRTLWMGIVSGVCFGIYFVLLKLASSGGVVWAMGMSRVASTFLAALLCIALAIRPSLSHKPSRWGWQTLALAVAVAALDTGGNVFYMLAAHQGRMDIAAALSSLYPAATILLAAWILKERTTRMQSLGMGLAVTAVVLISA